MEVLQRTANRGSISTALYEVDNSVKLDKGNDTTTVEFFERTVSSSGNRDVGTFSAWIKKTDVSTAQYLFTFGNTDNDNGRTFARFQTDGTLRIGGGTSVWRNTDRKFRDTSAWYHIVIAFDTTQSTANDRIKLYINGVQETSFSTTNNPSQNDDLGLAFEKQAIGYNTVDNNSGFNGYMSEVVIQDGVASAPTEFGKFDSDTGIWIPKDASDATMGTNGSYLKFENAASMGAASAGNAFTVQNINQNDQSTDTPTNNFCTWNPLVTNAGVFTYTEGATKWKPSSGNWQTTTASMGFTKGKWYAEFKMDGDVTSAMVGVQQLENDTTYDGYYLGYHTNTTSMGMGYYNADGNVYRNGGNTTYGASFPSSVLVGVALEFKDDGTANMYVAKDNVWQNSGDPANGTNGFALNYGNAVDDSGFFSFASSLYQNPGYWQANFGSYTTISISSAASDANGYGTFEYAPPTGYYALCTKNLSEFGG